MTGRLVRHGLVARAARPIALAAALVPAVAGVALAHPLGNFTINHYAGIRVEPSRVLLDVVIDEAEIPAFQATQALDADGDGVLSTSELAAARLTECVTVGRDLELTIGGREASLRLAEAGIAFPAGNGGLSTMRVACGFEAPVASLARTRTAVGFRDSFEASRIGWREITVVGSGMTVNAPGVPAESASARLTAYPSGLSGAPDVRSASFSVTPGGPSLPPFAMPDAQPIGPMDLASVDLARLRAPRSVSAAAPAAGPVSTTASAAPAAAVAMPAPVPGGEASIPEVLRNAPATPVVVLLALATAMALGAGHALTPGHGKTLMAAYLVGTRGTARHALGLGMAVSVSHTFGILGLAALVLAAQSALPPDVVVRAAPLVAAVSIVLIGGWMLASEVRRARRRVGATVLPAPDHGHADAHDHAHPQEHDHGGHREAPDDGLEHAHGGVRHRHVPVAGSTITWRGLFVLGLAGGLVPSTSALLILLATIAAGRAAWGVILVVAFGLGMAAVMAGVGLAFVRARDLVDRAPSRLRLASATRLIPAGAAVVVLGFGVVLTTQALAVARLG